MLYLTATEADRWPTLRDLSREAREQLLADGQRVLTYIRRNEWIADGDLRQYGERNDLSPDRLNAALALLREAGLLLALDTAGPLTAAPAPNPSPSDGAGG